MRDGTESQWRDNVLVYIGEAFRFEDRTSRLNVESYSLAGLKNIEFNACFRFQILRQALL